MENEERIRAKYKAIMPVLNERQRRVWVATEAKAIGRGGISLVQRSIGFFGEKTFIYQHLKYFVSKKSKFLDANCKKANS